MPTRSPRSTPEPPDRAVPDLGVPNWPAGTDDADTVEWRVPALAELTTPDTTAATRSTPVDPSSLMVDPITELTAPAAAPVAGPLAAVKRRLVEPYNLPEGGPEPAVPPRWVMAIGRFSVLALVTVLSLLATGSAWVLSFTALLAVAALPSIVPAPTRFARRTLVPLGRAAEIVITCFAAEFVVRHAHASLFSSPGAAAGAMLPYLAVPPVAAALARRRREALALVGLAIVVLIAVGLTDARVRDRGWVIEDVEWVLLTAVAAATASVLRGLLAQRRDRTPPYAEATRLLTQLRTVARQLPGATLDPGGLAEHLLDDVRQVARSDRAAVMCASGGNRLVVLAQSGATRVDWETSLDADSLISEAWANQLPQTGTASQARTHPGGDVSALVVPLAAGVRTVGLLTLEADVAGAYPRDVINRVSALAAPAALRLEAALLFDEVRSLATNEERQRLAREIHDGVAQELVMVGYGIDNAMAILPDDAAGAAGELRSLRSEVTRVITELRLSLFELRSEVDRHGGLAAAISEYARTVGASGGLRVHMSLDESTARLPAAVEGELLRIAQEAITNARKHAGASNLWVTCAVDPPFAQVEVSDDGHGLAEQRPDGRYGLAIMAERAERIRGRLEVRPRDPTGTTVAIVIGTSPRVR